jgi:hypothetical protein
MDGAPRAEPLMNTDYRIELTPRATVALIGAP